jgi:hypothetical protein
MNDKLFQCYCPHWRAREPEEQATISILSLRD